MTAETIDRLGGARPRTFLGQPVGLAYLAFTEVWERFSFYGMGAILVLYMSQALFLPGRIEHVGGFAAFRTGLEAVFGPMTTLALASQVYGLYAGLIYLTPVFGGMLADRWLGRRAAVVIGAVMMSAGHILMAFDAPFLAALALLIVGCGLLKGNISVQVGGLYGEHDGAGRTRGFAIFSTAINIGAVAGPLACGLAAQIWGWHAGFTLAGVLMLAALATYLAGYRHLPEPVHKTAITTPAAPLDARQWRVVAALVGVMAITIFQSIAYSQNLNIGLIWVDQKVDLAFGGFHVPVAWFGSIDSAASIASIPLLIGLWQRQAARGREPGEIGKIALGAWMAAAANLLLVVACLMSDRVSVIYPIVYDVILGVAFLYYWPTLLALVAGAAPTRVRATLMGLAFASNFIANILIGWIGGFYEHMTPAAFWGLHAAIGAAGGIIALLLLRPLERVLHES
jgi:POT family proton-dependent oligopeptide transporter